MDSCCEGEDKNMIGKKETTGNTNLVLWLILGAFTLVVVAAGFVIAAKSGQADLSPSNAKAVIAQTSYDWGKIDINGGDTTYTFTIENQGTDELKLTNIKTSCACTIAQVAINGVRSSYFGMHSTSSWVGVVPVGGQASLEVIFDPLYHGPTALGPIERIISIETNDSFSPLLELKLTGNVIKK